MTEQEKLDLIAQNGIDIDAELILMQNGEEIVATRQQKIDHYIDNITDPPGIYSQKRAGHYPAIHDQLDAILKYIDAKGDAGGDLAIVISRWKRVKALYPKKV